MPFMSTSNNFSQQWFRFIQVLLLLFVWQAAPAAAAQINQKAFDVVQSTTDELLARISERREAYREDRELFMTEVECLLLPVIDFKRIARRIMAKYYKQANSDQRERFEQVFKKSLMKLYALGLLEYDNQKVVVQEPGKSTSTKKQKVSVDIYADSGEKYPISYSMFVDANGLWKIENVVVNGINIGLTYRNQFSRLMKENRNDIDLVIVGWSAEVNNGE